MHTVDGGQLAEQGNLAIVDIVLVSDGILAGSEKEGGCRDDYQQSSFHSLSEITGPTD